MKHQLETLAQALAKQHIQRLESSLLLDRLDYTFDMPLEGDGWHGRETDGNTYWRFTGPTAIASLYFPRIRMHERTLRFSVFHAVTPAHLAELTATFNGVDLHCVERRLNLVTFRVPDSALEARAHAMIELSTPPAVRPNKGDDRLLGIGFTRIEAF